MWIIITNRIDCDKITLKTTVSKVQIYYWKEHTWLYEFSK